MTAILLVFFLLLLQKQTFLHQSTHQPIYILISNILCAPNAIVGRSQSLLLRCFVITTVTLPVTCHTRRREATFCHEDMLVSIRKKYHQTWRAIKNQRRKRFLETLKTIFYFRRAIYWKLQLLKNRVQISCSYRGNLRAPRFRLK